MGVEHLEAKKDKEGCHTHHNLEYDILVHKPPDDLREVEATIGANVEVEATSGAITIIRMFAFVVNMRVCLTEIMRISHLVALWGDKGQGMIPTMGKTHITAILLPHSPPITGIHPLETYIALVTGGVIIETIHTHMVRTPMATRVFARTATPKNEIQT